MRSSAAARIYAYLGALSVSGLLFFCYIKSLSSFAFQDVVALLFSVALITWFWFLEITLSWKGEEYGVALEGVFLLTLLLMKGALFALLAASLARALYVGLRKYPFRAQAMAVVLAVNAYSLGFAVASRVVLLDPAKPVISFAGLVLINTVVVIVSILLTALYDSARSGERLRRSLGPYFSLNLIFLNGVEILLIPCLAFICITLWGSGFLWAAVFLLPPFFGLRKAILSLQQTDKELQAMIDSFNTLVDAKDNFTERHIERVAEYSKVIARYYGLSESDIERIEKEARLHDIGKILVSDEVLKKPDVLTRDEYEQIKQHTYLDDILLSRMPGNFLLTRWLDTARLHHERYDGQGYPMGFRGEEIPLDARIIAVADAWDAMISRRVYRASLSDSTALEILKRHAGSQWDPRVVEAFFKAYEAGAIQAVAAAYQARLQQEEIEALRRFQEILA